MKTTNFKSDFIIELDKDHENVEGNSEKGADFGDEAEIPSKADIVRIVSKHFKSIFRQLADINQRLQFLEERT